MNKWRQTAGGAVFILTVLVVDRFVLVEPVVIPDAMVWLDGGSFTMGSDRGMPDERPAHRVELSGFWIDRYEVTNAGFAEFVDATGYSTYSEEVEDSLVFESPAQNQTLRHGPLDWWKLVTQADWRQPQGDGDSIAGKEDHPVVHVAYQDAAAYCDWAGKELPTEAQFEFAARGGREGEIYTWGDAPLHRTQALSNTWQGEFPFQDEGSDGYADTAPAGSFPANDYGLHDITGNVWEWVSDWYHPDYYRMSPTKNPRGVAKEESLDPNEPGLSKRGIRGGSFLCSDNYCQGFRVSARMPAEPLTSTNHTGFRCVINRYRI